MATKKREQVEIDRILKKRQKQSQKLTIAQIFEKENLNLKRANREWKQEFKRQENLMKKQILLDL